MTTGDILADAFDRIRQSVHQVLDGLDEQQLHDRVDGRSNSIAWLVWHLSRVQDDHVADLAGTEQVWTADGWYDRFGLPFPPEAHGYGMSSADVGRVRVPSPELLGDYCDAVCRRSVAWVADIDERELARVVDERYDPPVTVAVRLVSVIADDLEHAGQAAYVRGLLERRG